MAVEYPQEKLESLINCAICLEPILQPMKCPACNNNLCVGCVDQLAVRLYTENRRYSCPLCRAHAEPIQNQGIVQHLAILQASLEECGQEVQTCLDAYNRLEKVNFSKVESYLASVELLKPNSAITGEASQAAGGIDVRATQMKALLLHRQKLEEAKLKLEYFQERFACVHKMLKMQKKGLSEYSKKIVFGNSKIQHYIQWPFWIVYFLFGALIVKYLSIMFTPSR